MKYKFTFHSGLIITIPAKIISQLSEIYIPLWFDYHGPIISVVGGIVTFTFHSGLIITKAFQMRRFLYWIFTFHSGLIITKEIFNTFQINFTFTFHSGLIITVPFEKVVPDDQDLHSTLV